MRAPNSIGLANCIWLFSPHSYVQEKFTITIVPLYCSLVYKDLESFVAKD